jgi:hypothetical protein
MEKKQRYRWHGRDRKRKRGGTVIKIQGDQKVCMHLWGAMKNAVYSNNSHTIYDFKMIITEYVRNADRAILNTVFENTVRRVNKCLETGRGHFEHYM